MARHLDAKSALAGALLLGLAACGGGGASVASAPAVLPTPTPAPAPTPTPAAIPIPAPTVALLAPAQTASPASPIASAGGPNFNNPVTGTAFPVMLTAVTANVSGDAATTSQGGTLIQQAAGVSLSLANPALGFANVPAKPYSLPPDGGPVVVAFAQGVALEHMQFGVWTQPASANAYYDVGGGAWLGGYVTAAANIPQSGSASYSGKTHGLYSRTDFGSNPYCLCSGLLQVEGDVRLTADFAARSIAGTLTNLMFMEDAYEAPGFVVAFSASLDSATNLFSGTTRVTSTDPSTFSLSSTATGALAGRFFGSSAQEVGGVWTLSDSDRRMIGSFGARTGGP